MTHDQFPRLFNDLPECVRPAMLPLLTAIDYAGQSCSDRWDFAVEIELLSALHLSPNDFRWLVRNGLVEHCREVTLEGDDGRAFRTTGDLTFPERTCFVLTNAGVDFARAVLTSGQLSESRLPAQQEHITSQAQDDESQRNGSPSDNRIEYVLVQTPHWDSERRVLGVNETIVKCFKWVAVNQQAVLNAFEEDGWPPRIDDPLPPKSEQDSKRRLSDTIKCLNRKQSHPLIHFRGDGTGEGIIWEFADESDNG